jgi:hypothetical protein
MKFFKILILNTLFIFLTYNFIFACSGSCLLCHKDMDLNKPSQHKIIKECINCHSKGCGENSFLEDKEAETSCGSDCFNCHKTLPKDSSHIKITECVSCHKKLELIK